VTSRSLELIVRSLPIGVGRRELDCWGGATERPDLPA
jgi:hypothetical protein